MSLTVFSSMLQDPWALLISFSNSGKQMVCGMLSEICKDIINYKISKMTSQHRFSSCPYAVSDNSTTAPLVKSRISIVPVIDIPITLENLLD
ncbi:hypothetical protein NMG60_11023233 [Bertholletia excelsa]